jgi:hypothetical protein
MPLRALSLVLALLVLGALTSTAAGQAQSEQEDLSELWREYPLDPAPEEPRSVGAREERGSTAGPPPSPARPAGPFPLALLFLALALALLGVAGGALKGLGRLRERRRARAASRGLARRGLLGGGDG